MSDQPEYSRPNSENRGTAQSGNPPVWIDRRRHGQEIANSILSSSSPIVVLHGELGIGKTQLVRRWIIPEISAQRPVYYWEIIDAFPTQVLGGQEEKELKLAVQDTSIVFLDAFEQLLAVEEARQHKVIEELKGLMRTEGFQSKLVLVINEDCLGSLFSLSGELPELLGSVLKIESLTLKEGLEALSARSATHVPDCSPEVVNALIQDGASLGISKGISSDLLQILTRQFQSYREKSGAERIELGSYQKLGGLRGILKSYLKAKLEELPTDVSETASNLLENLTITAQGRHFLPSLAASLDLSDASCAQILELLEQAGLIRGNLEEGYRVVPDHLSTLIQEEARKVQKQLRKMEETLQRALASWIEIRALLPKSRFEQIHSLRRLLRVDEQTKQFMLFCALHHDGSKDLTACRHWLRRIRGDSMKADLLIRSLFAKASRVRRRAATFLGEFPRPEVQAQLHLLALRDPEPQVREKAVASLEKMKDDRLFQMLSLEIRDRKSRYRRAALECLQAFPEERTCRTLKEIVADRSSELHIREKAIEVLGKLHIPQSVDALLEIALEDEDLEDRQGAAQALAGLAADHRVNYLIDRLKASVHHSPRQWQKNLQSFFTSFAFFKFLLSALVVLGNAFIHGLSLMVLRRFKLGAAFLGIEIALIALGSEQIQALQVETVKVGLIVNWLLSQLIPARRLLLQRGSMLIDPYSFAAMLNLALFISNALFIFSWLHGLAHMMTRRVWRGLFLVAMEACGLALLYLNSIVPPDWFLGAVYATVIVLFFFGSWFFDVAVVLCNNVLLSKTLGLRSRKAHLQQALMANRHFVSKAFEDLESSGAADRKWAASILKRHSRHIAPEQLADCLIAKRKEGRKLAVRGLIQAKTKAVIHSLEESWPLADLGLRQGILSVLSWKPTPHSLEAIERLGGGLSWREKLQVVCSQWLYRFQIWPNPVKWACVLMLPFAVAFTTEGVKGHYKPERPFLRIVRNPLEPIENRIKTAEAVARIYPDASAGPLTAVFHDTNNDALRKGLAESLKVLLQVSRKPHPAVLNELVQAVSRGNQDALRESAFDALKEIGNDPEQAIGPDGVQTLFEVLQDSGDAQWYRSGALEILGSLLSAEAVQALENFVLQPVAPAALRDKPVDFFDREQDLRKKALRTLGRPGSAESLQALQRLAEDQDLSKDLRKTAAKMLESLPKPSVSVDALRALFEAGNYSETVRQGEEALRPERVQEGSWKAKVYSLVGRAYAAQSRHDSGQASPSRAAAIRNLEQARELGQGNADVLSDLGSCYYDEAAYLRDSGQPEKSMDAVIKAIEVTPEDPSSHALRGLLYSDSGNSKQALESLQKALDYAPDYVWALNMKASILLKAHDKEEQDKQAQAEALEVAKKAVRLDANNPWSQLLLRQAYHGLDQDQQAVAHFRSLQESSPDDINLSLQLVFIYHEYLSERDPFAFEDCFEELSKVFQKAEEDAHPNANSLNTDLLANFAESHFTVGLYAQAALRAQEVLGRPDRSPSTTLSMLVIRYLAFAFLGDFDQARSQLRQIEAFYKRPPEGFEPDWSYVGLTNYVRLRASKQLPAGLQDPLLRLLELASNTDEKTFEASAQFKSVFSSNRKAVENQADLLSRISQGLSSRVSPEEP